MGHVSMSDHYPIICGIEPEMETISDELSGEEQFTMYEGDKWKLDREKLDEVNSKIRDGLSELMQEVPEKCSDLRIRIMTRII